MVRTPVQPHAYAVADDALPEADQPSGQSFDDNKVIDISES
jgi:hypothetical protein